MIQHNMQTLKVGHKVRLLDCHFVILSFFHFAVGGTNRGLLVRYIYIIYYFIIYILYIIYTHGAKMTKWQNDKMTFFVKTEKWVPYWLMDGFNKHWWMTSVKTNKWHSYRCMCVRVWFVCACECHLSESTKMKKKCLRNKKKSHFYWQRCIHGSNFALFSCLTL